MSRDDRDNEYLLHILESAERIGMFIGSMSKAKFFKDEKTQSAVIREFSVIGEATKRLSEQTRTKERDVEWGQIAGMRDKLIHDYFDIDLGIVWRAAKVDLPRFVRSVHRLASRKK